MKIKLYLLVKIMRACGIGVVRNKRLSHQNKRSSWTLLEHDDS